MTPREEAQEKLREYVSRENVPVGYYEWNDEHGLGPESALVADVVSDVWEPLLREAYAALIDVFDEGGFDGISDEMTYHQIDVSNKYWRLVESAKNFHSC